jgi:thiol-disulfide isomerase/thioredoxin
MRTFVVLLLIATIVSAGNAQESLSKRTIPLPSVDVKTLNGSSFNTQNMDNEGKPIIICFFASWCKPCMIELSNIADEYEEWQSETGVKIYAVAIDDARSSSKVAPLVRSKGWEYEVLLDVNSDFKRAMNVNDIPHTFVLNGNKEIVWQHASYSPGVEAEYIEAVKKILNGEAK